MEGRAGSLLDGVANAAEQPSRSVPLHRQRKDRAEVGVGRNDYALFTPREHAVVGRCHASPSLYHATEAAEVDVQALVASSVCRGQINDLWRDDLDVVVDCKRDRFGV